MNVLRAIEGFRARPVAPVASPRGDVPTRARARRVLVVCSGLAAFAPLGCGSDEGADAVELELAFEAVVDGEPARCGRSYGELGASGATAQLADARMFLSGFEVRAGDGPWLPTVLVDSDWQRGGVALLDFEDGAQGCSESGNPELNSRVVLQAPPGDYDAVRFDVRVPFEANHLDVDTAAAPLNDPSMWWVWRAGYKFLRVDWMVDGGAVPRWNTHLGTTGCMSSDPSAPPAEPCARANAPAIEVRGMDLDSDVLRIDLAALVAGADLLVDIPETPPGCQSNPMESADCEEVFSALGLEFSDGTCESGCRGQSVFSVSP